MNAPTIELTREEFEQASEVQKVLSSKAWPIISGMIEQQIQATLQAMEKARREDHWRYQQGILKGMRLIAQIPYKIVERAEEARKSRNRED